MNNQFIFENKQGKITAFDLKLIAVFFMLVDHTAVAVVRDVASAYGYNCYFGFVDNVSTAYTIMRYLGRLAFPIYCFFIVEGLLHTRSRTRYAIRLFVLAILSEIPFDYALFNSQLVDMKHNNVFWTLLIALLGIWGIDEIKKRETGLLENPFVKEVAVVGISAVAMGLAYLMKTDYRHAGVGAIIIMYLLYDRDKLLALAGGIVFLGFTSSKSEFFALLVLIPMYFYNGSLGRSNKAIKWGFYFFYPCHLLLLSLIRYLILK